MSSLVSLCTTKNKKLASTEVNKNKQQKRTRKEKKTIPTHSLQKKKKMFPGFVQMFLVHKFLSLT